ncbi:hypothetical protein [Mycobacterium sp. ITM-2016-00318]|uniref:hypothetical protein n=1 Tax=Mycobacterium sp. ITM-2016-00318 TaxID=2099693 RepID=UPI00115B5545|nr:hypothetical protein [Mycobacterium sp. ITM-2016-00318]WNG94616.1 hypothetical protein C6A82_009405 [Mycobacterium sp. ITM-2016-00318]
MRKFVRPFSSAIIAAAAAGILIAAPVNAAPATDPNPESGIDDVLRRCALSGDPETCTREILEDECTSSACLRTNPNDVFIGADNPNGRSIGAAKQTADSPGASNQNPSPGPTNRNTNGPNGSNKNG